MFTMDAITKQLGVWWDAISAWFITTVWQPGTELAISLGMELQTLIISGISLLIVPIAGFTYIYIMWVDDD